MTPLYIFDMGGVLVERSDVLPDIARHLDLSVPELHNYCRDIWTPLMDGRVTAQEFWQMFSERSGIRVEEELFGKFFRPLQNPAMYALIRQLKTRARVVCGTNTLEEHYAIHRAQGDYDVFDAVYASHVIRIAKPQPEFYRHIIDREQSLPAQTIFIDDMLKNVEAARFLGIHAIHFMGYDGLIEQLHVS